MPEERYNVLIGKQIQAENMTLDNALIFTKALFQNFWADPDIEITINKLKYQDIYEENEK